jgi:apolipoprotein D and lipocalin family protein
MMITRAWTALISGLVCAAIVNAAELLPLATVPTVDIGRYAGTWYEIARYPNRFQRQCVGDVVARYRSLPDGTIEVINSCRTVSGRDEVQGAARPLAAGDFARLEVRFAPAWLSFLPFVWGQYWVINLAADYSYAVIGEPSREYLWVLARSPHIDDATLQELLQHAAGQGYDPARVVRTAQTGTE